MATDCGIQLRESMNELTKKMAEALNEKLTDFTGDKGKTVKYLEAALGDINRQLEKALSENYTKGMTDEAIAKLQTRTDIEFMNLYSTLSAADGMAKNLQTRFEGAKSVEDMKGAFLSYAQDVQTIVRGEEIWLDNQIADAFSTIETSGVRSNPRAEARAEKLQLKGQSTGRDDALAKIIKAHGYEGDAQFKIYTAIKHGKGADGIPELDAIVRAHKQWKKQAFNKTKKEAPYIGDTDDYAISTKPVGESLIDKDEFVDFMMGLKLDRVKDTGIKDISDADYRKWLEDQFDFHSRDPGFKADGEYKSTTSVYRSRIFHFMDDADEFKYLKKYGQLKNQGVLSAMYRHQKKLLTATASHNTFGADAGFSLANVKRLAAKAAKDKKGDVTSFNNLVDREMKMVAEYTGRLSVGEETAYAGIRAASNGLSAMLTGFSAIRDFVLDKTFISGFNRAMMTKGSATLEIMKSYGSLTKELFSNQKDLNRLIELNGVAVDIKMRNQNQGVIDDVIAGQTAGKAAKAVHGAERFTRGAAQTVSIVSLADRVNRSARRRDYKYWSAFLSDGLKYDLADAPTAVKAFAKNRGIDEDIWNILKVLPKLEYQGFLGKTDLGIDIRGFDDLPDEIIKGVRRGTETADQTRRRLRSSWVSFINDLVDVAAPMISRRGRTFDKTGQSLLDGLSTFVFKFKDIALSQHYNTLRAMDAAAGFNPDHITHLSSYGKMGRQFKTPKGAANMIARYIPTMLVGGMITLWTRDILSGKTPRAISPESILEAAMVSGGGGAAAIMLEQFMWSDDIIQSPLEAVGKPAKGLMKALASGDEDKIKKATRRAIETLPGMNLWWTQHGARSLLREAFDEDRYTPFEERLMDEKGQEPLEDADFDDFLDNIVDYDAFMEIGETAENYKEMFED